MQMFETTGVPDGIHTIRYHGYSRRSLPCSCGLVVDSSTDGLIFISDTGKQQKLGRGYYGSWLPREAGVAIQKGGTYYLASYSGRRHQPIHRNDVPWLMRCTSSGIILNHDEGFLYVPFDCSAPKILWRQETRCDCAVIDDGIVVRSGKTWLHINVSGDQNLIYEESDDRQNTGVIGSGYVWSHRANVSILYYWDGREPATTKYAGCGGCSEGIVANFTDKVIIYRFGGGELLLWEGAYDKWHGSCDIGLFITTKEEQILLLPYDGSQPKLLWEGPFDELCPNDKALIIRNAREVVMIPLPQ